MDNITYFGSNMSEPWRKLSNLYEAPIKYKGNTYLSIEHIYQSLKFKIEDSTIFLINGDLSNYEVLIKFSNKIYN